MQGLGLTRQLHLVRACLKEICSEHTVGRATYDRDYNEYRLEVDGSYLGTLATAKEWLTE
jgi:hypothetical protein